ncbi:hypothetical protein J6590_105026, partial [Homalodisca vitripennis]
SNLVCEENNSTQGPAVPRVVSAIRGGARRGRTRRERQDLERTAPRLIISLSGAFWFVSSLTADFVITMSVIVSI